MHHIISPGVTWTLAHTCLIKCLQVYLFLAGSVQCFVGDFSERLTHSSSFITVTTTLDVFVMWHDSPSMVRGWGRKPVVIVCLHSVPPRTGNTPCNVQFHLWNHTTHLHNWRHHFLKRYFPLWFVKKQSASTRPSFDKISPSRWELKTSQISMSG